MVVVALAGGFLWGVHGTVKGVPALGLYASSAALSSGIAGVTFFGKFCVLVYVTLIHQSDSGTREYLISPLFTSTFSTNQYIRQRRTRSPDTTAFTEPLPPPTFGEMRFTRVPDTAASGAISGALLTSWKRKSLPTCSSIYANEIPS